MLKNVFCLVLTLCLKLGWIQSKNDIQARRPIDEFTDTGKRVAAWMEHQIGNPEELGDRFESDIDKYPDEEISRNGVVGSRFRWPGAQIPYVISGQFKSSDLQNIRLAFDAFHKNTCIRFRPRTSKDDHYIDITSKNDGCYSSVGRLIGKQTVNLQTPGCNRFGTVAHELMHIAGFYHEHSRFDRDDYVTILTQNIKKGAEGNFFKHDNRSTTTFGAPYDYGSILHYSRYAFSVQPGTKPTILPKKPPNAIIGQRDKLSPIDIRKLRSMYNCR